MTKASTKRWEKGKLLYGANQQGGNQQRPFAGMPLPPRQEGSDANGGTTGNRYQLRA